MRIKILCAILIALAALAPNGNARYDTAIVTDSYYDYGDDADIVYFVTPDGNEWAIYNEIIPEGTEIIVKFDTKGNENIYDDEVLWIERR